MQDFDDALAEVCRSVLLEVLDERGRHSTPWWLARSGVSMADCARKLQEFDDALVELFQPMGALILKARILSRFYRSRGARYERGETLAFTDEVAEARRLYSATMPI